MNKQKTEVISFQGGDGSTIYDAITIIGATSFFTGLNAEFEFINASFCNVISAQGKTIIFPNAAMHQVEVITSNGIVRNIFFNATDFHSKIEVEPVDIVHVFTPVN